MNSVVLIGRLTKDPDVRETQNGKFARYTLAVDRRYRKDGEEQKADFISCVVFGKGAEFAEYYLHQGIKIGVTGRLQTGSYTNREGARVYTTDVIVESQEFVESKAASEGSAPSQAAQTATMAGDPMTDPDGFMTIPDGLQEELPFH